MFELAVAVVVLSALAALSSLLARRSPVKERGAFGSAWERFWARRPAPRSGSGPATPMEGETGKEAERTPRQDQFGEQAKKAKGGVLRLVIAKVTRARKWQVRWDLKVERLRPRGAHAATRVDQAIEAEAALQKRLAARGVETLGYRSPWPARVIAGLLFLGGCILNANTYAEFEASRQDVVTRLLEQIGMTPAWALGAFQMAGFTVIGYAVATCLSYALAPKRDLYEAPQGDAKDGPDDPDPDGKKKIVKKRIVYGHFSPTVYAVFAVVFLASALVVAYAMARLRMYGTLLDAAAATGAPSTGTAGSLAGGATAVTSGQPDGLLVFMVLALLELVATIAVFVCLDPAVPRTLRHLHKNTEKALRAAEKAARKANRARERGAGAGLDAHAALIDGRVRKMQADVHARELDANYREANPDVSPAMYKPEEPSMPKVLPDSAELDTPRTTPLSYPESAQAPEVDRGDEETQAPQTAPADTEAHPGASGPNNDGKEALRQAGVTVDDYEKHIPTEASGTNSSRNGGSAPSERA